MPQAQNTSNASAHAQAILNRTGLVRNGYVRSLRDGSMSLEAFRRTQEQFYFAVEFYPRPMAALVSRIPDAGSRIGILRNLIEEHGDFDAAAFHRSTFRKFLSRIGVDPARLESLRIAPGVRAFNCVLQAACGLEELGVGIGCMGIIELAFASISAEIGRCVVDRSWVLEEDLVHYALHAELDVRHAEDFFMAAEPYWLDPCRRQQVMDGLELGAHAFGRLYADLLDAALTHPTPQASLPTSRLAPSWPGAGLHG